MILTNLEYPLIPEHLWKVDEIEVLRGTGESGIEPTIKVFA